MTTAPAATIEIPRLVADGESARAHAAKVAYVTMGPERSLDKLRQRLGKSSAGYTRQLEEWSSRYGWRDAARHYDEAMTVIAIHDAAAAYRRDLDAHRDDAMKYGKALCGVAVRMLDALNKQFPTLEYTPASIITIARALTVGMDLQAHALRVAELLPKLDAEDGRDSE